MLKAIDSRTIDVGSRLNISPERRVIVVANDPDGLSVMYFTPEGLGPLYATLPHAELVTHLYEDERAGRGQHYTEFHPDFTGQSGEA